MEELSAVVRLVIPGSILVYLVSMIGIGVYSVTRREGRGDWFTSNAVRYAAVVVVGLSSVLPTELLSIRWMALLQRDADLTANLFLLVPVPVVALMVAFQAFVLSRIYRAAPLRYAAVFLGVHAAGYAMWLTRLFNPPADVARYAAVVLVVGALVMWLFARFAWRRAPA